MVGGTLFVSRAECLQPDIKEWLESLGFFNVTVTAAEKDALDMAIDELKPRLVMIGAGFYQAGTPYMTGELLKQFPKLNIAAVCMHQYPLSLAAWFIWHGVKSYLNLWEGSAEFKRGLQVVRNGEPYISPKVQSLIENKHDWPDVGNQVTKRHKECLVMLCCGFIAERIGEELYISRKTVTNHLASLYSMFHVNSREEMVALAWELDLITKDDIRFYREKSGFEQIPLPDWAEAKKKSDNKMLWFPGAKEERGIRNEKRA